MELLDLEAVRTKWWEPYIDSTCPAPLCVVHSNKHFIARPDACVPSPEPVLAAPNPSAPSGAASSSASADGPGEGGMRRGRSQTRQEPSTDASGPPQGHRSTGKAADAPSVASDGEEEVADVEEEPQPPRKSARPKRPTSRVRDTPARKAKTVSQAPGTSSGAKGKRKAEGPLPDGEERSRVGDLKLF